MSFAEFLNGFFLLSFKSSLQILNMNTLLAMWFANIFSQCLSLSFHLLEGFFWQSKSPYFFCYGLYFYGVMSKYSLSSCRSQMVSPICFSKSFRTLCFTLKCIIHLRKFCGSSKVYIEVYFLSSGAQMSNYSGNICWKC